MKKIFLGLVAITISLAVVSQQPTIVTSTLEFAPCKTTYSTLVNIVRNVTFPYEWENIIWTQGGTKILVLENHAGCDSIASYTLDAYTPSSHSFTVSSDPNAPKIVFSPGNLQYQASSKTWRFAPEQYNMIGSTRGNTTKTDSDSPTRSTQTYWIDLFSFGTSGYSKKPYEYYDNYVKESIIGSNNDWGLYNNDVLGGNPDNKWRTPSQDEWNYLINTRTDKRGLGTVNNVKGLILLPDDWSLPEHCSFNSVATNCTTNVYSSTDEYETWSRMEAAGAVFLPMAGYCKNDAGAAAVYTTAGYYWASELAIYKYSTYESSWYYKAAYLEFSNSNIIVNTTQNLVAQAIKQHTADLCRSVRLIRNAD